MQVRVELKATYPRARGHSQRDPVRNKLVSDGAEMKHEMSRQNE